MALSPLVSQIADRMKADGLTVTAAAKKIGVVAAGLGALLKGKSKPNARSLPRYATFLGISAEEIAGLTGKNAKAPSKAARRGRKVKAASASLGRTTKSSTVSAAIAAIKALEDQADLSRAILADPLAVAVHKASKSQRQLLATILKASR